MALTSDASFTQKQSLCGDDDETSTSQRYEASAIAVGNVDAKGEKRVKNDDIDSSKKFAIGDWVRRDAQI